MPEVKTRTMPLVVGAVFFILVGVLVRGGIEKYCALPSGVFVQASGAVTPGYLLLSPYQSSELNSDPGEVLLVNERGITVHRWETRYQALHAVLMPSGDIYAVLTPPLELAKTPGGGTTGIIERIDWEGNVLWEYEDPLMTHDFEVLPDGSLALVRWAMMPQALGKRVVGGLRTATTTLWSNDIIVVNADKEIVWQWKLYEHIDPSEYPLGPLVPRTDTAHVNSIRYVASNPLTHTPAYLLSVRHFNAVMLVDAQSGQIIWRSPERMFTMQHDATFLDNGNVLLFDNGLFRNQPRAYLASRVVEVDPRTNSIVWEYDGGESGTSKAMFASSIMGGAQRLPNGNTLITESVAGRVFEVTPEKEIVWSYLNDFYESGSERIIFKTRKYDPAKTSWGPRVGSFSPVCGK